MKWLSEHWWHFLNRLLIVVFFGLFILLFCCVDEWLF